LEIAAISPADFRSWASNIFLILYPSNHIVERPLAPLYPGNEVQIMEIRGRDLAAGEPKTIEITDEEIRKALM